MMGFVLQDGGSPLGAASNNGHLDVVITLMEAGANINQADKVRIHTATVHGIILPVIIEICVHVTKQHTQLGVVCEGDGMVFDVYCDFP